MISHRGNIKIFQQNLLQRLLSSPETQSDDYQQEHENDPFLCINTPLVDSSVLLLSRTLSFHQFDFILIQWSGNWFRSWDTGRLVRCGVILTDELLNWKKKEENIENEAIAQEHLRHQHIRAASPPGHAGFNQIANNIWKVHAVKPALPECGLVLVLIGGFCFCT